MKSAAEFQRRDRASPASCSPSSTATPAAARRSPPPPVTGQPVKFAGTGEKVDAFELFDLERMVSRASRHGRRARADRAAEETVDREQAEASGVGEAAPQRVHARGLPRPDSSASCARWARCDQVLSMIPAQSGVDEGRRPRARRAELRRTIAIIDSMTPRERTEPSVINGSRQEAHRPGSGTGVEDVNRLLKQFAQARKLMKQLGGGRRGHEAARLPHAPQLAVRRRREEEGCWSIRLRRTGSTKRPYYRVVVADSRNWRDGRFIEVPGPLRPAQEPGRRQDRHRAGDGLDRQGGRRPADTVRSLLKRSAATAVAAAPRSEPTMEPPPVRRARPAHRTRGLVREPGRVRARSGRGRYHRARARGRPERPRPGDRPRRTHRPTRCGCWSTALCSGAAIACELEILRLMPTVADLVLDRPGRQAAGAQGRGARWSPSPDREDRFPRLARASCPTPDGGSREVEVERVLAAQGPLRAEAPRASTRSTQARGLARARSCGSPRASLQTLPAGLVLPPPASGLKVVDERGAELGTCRERDGDRWPRRASWWCADPKARRCCRSPRPCDPHVDRSRARCAGCRRGPSTSMRIDVAHDLPAHARGPAGRRHRERACGQAARRASTSTTCASTPTTGTAPSTTRPSAAAPDMVMKAEPFRARAREDPGRGAARRARRWCCYRRAGARFDQQPARRLAGLERLVLLCGRYEGIDERVAATPVPPKS